MIYYKSLINHLIMQIYIIVYLYFIICINMLWAFLLPVNVLFERTLRSCLIYIISFEISWQVGILFRYFYSQLRSDSLFCHWCIVLEDFLIISNFAASLRIGCPFCWSILSIHLYYRLLTKFITHCRFYIHAKTILFFIQFFIN
jgi:hypothetical protein